MCTCSILHVETELPAFIGRKVRRVRVLLNGMLDRNSVWGMRCFSMPCNLRMNLDRDGKRAITS